MKKIRPHYTDYGSSALLFLNVAEDGSRRVYNLSQSSNAVHHTSYTCYLRIFKLKTLKLMKNKTLESTLRAQNKHINIFYKTIITHTVLRN